MARLEWNALRAEAEGTLQGDREGREHRRLLDRLLADHRRSLAAPPPQPADPMDAIKQHLAARAAHRSAAE